MTTPESPLVVLLHGTRMTSAMWLPYHRLLPELTLVTPNLPGHGERVGEPFTMETVCAVIDAAVAQRGPGQRVVLAGHSLGGYVATLWAARNPQRLDALLLMGASADPRGSWAWIYRWFARMVPRIGAERLSRISNRVMWLIGARGDKAASLPDASGYAALPQAWQLVMEHCSPDLLRGLECPVVLACGQWDQMRVDVDRYAEAAAKPYVVTIGGGTHLVPVTHPEQVAPVIRGAARRATWGAPSEATWENGHRAFPE